MLSFLPEFSSFTRDDIALVTESAACNRSLLRLRAPVWFTSCSPKACLISPSTPLSACWEESGLVPGSLGCLGLLVKSSGEDEPASRAVFGLRGGRGEPACNGKTCKVKPWTKLTPLSCRAFLYWKLFRKTFPVVCYRELFQLSETVLLTLAVILPFSLNFSVICSQLTKFLKFTTFSNLTFWRITNIKHFYLSRTVSHSTCFQQQVHNRDRLVWSFKTLVTTNKYTYKF